jgi:hypothetical protein
VTSERQTVETGRTSVKKFLPPQAMRGIWLGMRGLVRSYVTLAIMLWANPAQYIFKWSGWSYTTTPRPCGWEFEYVHRGPASCRRRRKGKSQIWDTRRWSRVSRKSDQRKATMAKANSIYKIQTRPLVREGAPENNQDRNCQKVINIWLWVPDENRHQDVLIDWPSVAIWLWLYLHSPYVIMNWCLIN